jgi:hypothetical protein
LCELVNTFDLELVLSEGTQTVFAPTNDAFFAINSIIAGLTDATILDILLFHVIADKSAASTDFVCNAFESMANGKESQTLCNVQSIPSFQVGEDNLPGLLPAFTATDIQACNGIVHVVNNVLLPIGTFPSEMPSSPPSIQPSSQPSQSRDTRTLPPTVSPTPSAFPSPEPSQIPSALPSRVPSSLPSIQPSGAPTPSPEDAGTTSPPGSTSVPSAMPSFDPSQAPSLICSSIGKCMKKSGI